MTLTKYFNIKIIIYISPIVSLHGLWAHLYKKPPSPSLFLERGKRKRKAHSRRRKKSRRGAKPPLKPAKAGSEAFPEERKGGRREAIPIQEPPDPFQAAKAAAKAAATRIHKLHLFCRFSNEFLTCFLTNQGNSLQNRGTQSLFHHSGYPSSLSPISVEPRHCRKLPQKCPAGEVEEECPLDRSFSSQPAPPPVKF